MPSIKPSGRGGRTAKPKAPSLKGSRVDDAGRERLMFALDDLLEAKARLDGLLRR